MNEDAKRGNSEDALSVTKNMRGFETVNSEFERNVFKQPNS